MIAFELDDCAQSPEGDQLVRHLDDFVAAHNFGRQRTHTL